MRRGWAYPGLDGGDERVSAQLPTAEGFLFTFHSKWQPLATWGQACGTPGRADGMVTNAIATCLLYGAQRGGRT